MLLLHNGGEMKAGKFDLKIHNQKYILLYFAYFLLTGRRNSVDPERQSLFVCLWYCIIVAMHFE